MRAHSVSQFNLGPVDQIPIGEGREFEVGGRSIAVFRSRNGRIYASQAQCPHRQGPLADGILGGRTVICPFHSWRFDLESGKGGPDGCQLDTYPVFLADNGEMILSLEEASAVA